MMHAPTPYATVVTNNGDVFICDKNDDVLFIGEGNSNDDSTADLIVTAVNNHDALVAEKDALVGALTLALVRLKAANKHISCEEEIYLCEAVFSGMEKSKS